MRKIILSILFALFGILFLGYKLPVYANTYIECESGASNACTAIGAVRGDLTQVTNNNGSYSCKILGQYRCADPYWGNCGNNGVNKCWAGLPGTKPSGVSDSQLSGLYTYGSGACGVQATFSPAIKSDAALYCVCGVPGASPCPQPPTLTPSPTPAGPVPTLTPTPAPADTFLNIAIKLPGIGQGGNLSPKHPTRIIHVSIYRSTDDPTQPNINPIFDSKTISITFNSNNGYFANTAVDVGTLPTGDYQILFKSPGYLRKEVVNPTDQTTTIHITGTTTTQIPATTLIVGDVAALYNVMDISDFYGLVGCYQDKSTSSTCTIGAQMADLNDDGVVDGIDLNYWLLGMNSALQSNSTNPGNGDGVTGD